MITYDLPIQLSHTVKSCLSYAYTSNYRNVVFICNYCHKELVTIVTKNYCHKEFYL